MEDSPRTPITLLTGHLGSGKTTLLNAYLRAPEARDVAVVINEFGDVGLDHLLVQQSSENLVLLENGCLCCTVRGDLIATLRDLVTRCDAGAIPAFHRVVIETTGLADPAPVIHSLMNDLALILRFRLDRVLTVVAAVPGRSTLDAFAEARRQVAFADALVMTKIDLGEPADLEPALRGLNPRAELHRVSAGAAGAALFEGGGFEPGEAMETWLGASRFACDSVSPHGAEIGSFCLTLPEALPWSVAQRWLDRIAAEHGPDLLRLKGMLAICEWPAGPVVVHGVQHLFHPPEMRESWPSDDHRSRIVFITRGIDAARIEDTLRQAQLQEAV